MRGAALLLLLGLLACDDTDFHGAEPEVVDCDLSADYCGVQAVFEAYCYACHDAGAVTAGLDLETDAWSALVGVESANSPGAVLVEPGDAEASLLYRKLTSSQAEGEGGGMPPSGSLDGNSLDLVKGWIDAGATAACEGEADTGGGA